MTSRELSEWMAFYQLEPWGADVDDWRAGMIASVVANANRDPKKRRKPFAPQDFMPDRATSSAEQSDDEIERVLRMWESVLGRKTEE